MVDEPRGAGPEAASADSLLDALWSRVLSHWDDDKVHTALLEYAIRAERLPDVAGRYRALKDDPEKGALAAKKVDAVVLAATQLLLASKTPRTDRVPWQLTAAAAVIFAGLVLWVARTLLGGR